MLRRGWLTAFLTQHGCLLFKGLFCILFRTLLVGRNAFQTVKRGVEAGQQLVFCCNLSASMVCIVNTYQDYKERDKCKEEQNFPIFLSVVFFSSLHESFFWQKKVTLNRKHVLWTLLRKIVPNVVFCISFSCSKCFSVFQSSMEYNFFNCGFQILVSVLQGRWELSWVNLIS